MLAISQGNRCEEPVWNGHLLRMSGSYTPMELRSLADAIENSTEYQRGVRAGRDQVHKELAEAIMQERISVAILRDHDDVKVQFGNFGERTHDSTG